MCPEVTDPKQTFLLLTYPLILEPRAEELGWIKWDLLSPNLPGTDLDLHRRSESFIPLECNFVSFSLFYLTLGLCIYWESYEVT